MRGKSKLNKPVTDESEPKQVAQEPDDDREHGLWVNEAFFRKHQNRPPILALRTETPSASEDRYVGLADIALGLKQPKPPKSMAPPNAEDVEKSATPPKRYCVGRRSKPRTKGS